MKTYSQSVLHRSDTQCISSADLFRFKVASVLDQGSLSLLVFEQCFSHRKTGDTGHWILPIFSMCLRYHVRILGNAPRSKDFHGYNCSY